jgi:hypothetical protein
LSSDDFPDVRVTDTHPLFDVDLPPSDAVPAPGSGWITIPHKGKKLSFAVAAAAGSVPSPSPTTTTAVTAVNPNPALDLSKADLDKLSKEGVHKLYNAGFNVNVPKATKLTKDQLIATYVARSNAPIVPNPPQAQGPQASDHLTMHGGP